MISPPKPPPSSIAEWLESVGLAQYAQAFIENDIDVAVLGELTDTDLESLGVSLGHRRKLLKAIAEAALAARRNEREMKRLLPPDGAERRQLTVLFCDLVGSTALSARLDPEDMREVINVYQHCCADVIAKAGGYVSRYVGDGVLAYFGYPEAHENDAERAVGAGLSLIRLVGDLAVGEIGPLRVRIGIATGVVVVGDLSGQGEAQQRGVVGETPNLASRLQSVAEPGEIVISHGTRRLTHGLFEYVDLGLLHLRGIPGPVRAWRVLGPSAAESRFEALHEAGLTRLVGREEEIDLVLRRWKQAREGDGSVVLVSGEPGIGKSRITQAVLERLSGEAFVPLRLVCSPDHQDTALHPYIAHLQRAASFKREDTDAQKLDKLEALLARAGLGGDDTTPLLAELLSLSWTDRYGSLNANPHWRKEQTLQRLLAYIEGLAAQRPILIAFEDAHWSDPSSLELLDRIIDRVPGLPVLMIIAFRPKFSAPWIGRSYVTSILLNRLPPRRCVELISLVTAGKVLPKQVVEQIIDRTDGVPLFIEELTKAIVESDLLVDAGDHYAIAGPLPQRAIPMTLHASLLARLDRLGSARQVAQIGAALGRHFSYELISGVAPLPRPQLDEALAQLVDAELVFSHGLPPEAEYIFKHALVQDAAYSTLLRSDRRQVHARIVAVLEARFPEIVAGQPGFLAHHCGEASLAAKAVEYWLSAGQQAVARSAMTEAAAQLRRGLDLLARLPDDTWRQQRELDLHMALGRALVATRGHSAAVVGETFARARVLAERLGRRDYLIPLLQGQWVYHLVRSELRLALAHAEELGQIAETRNDVDAQLLAHYANGMILFYLGEFEPARTHFEQCRGLRDHLNAGMVPTLSPADYPAAMMHLVWTLLCLGRVDLARSHLDELLRGAQRLGHAYTRAMTLSFACWAEWIGREPEKVQLHAEEAIALSLEQNFPLWLAWGTSYRGWSLAVSHQQEAGIGLLRKGLAEVRATGTVVMTPYWLMLMAEAHAALGQTEQGLNCLDEAAQILETAEERFEEAELHRLRGDLLSELRRPEAAERSYQHAIAIAVRQGATLWQLRAASGLARLWRRAGRVSEAHDLLAPVCARLAGEQDALDVQAATALLAGLAAQRKRHRQNRSLIDRDGD